jgi:translation initiation factor IF-3
VPVPRRFDRRPPERDTTKINERIRVPEVRLIDDEGNQIGVMKTPDALVFAQERDLDLVEVAPEARPPVCRVLDYSKYKYEQAQKLKQARKHQQQITIREIKFRPKIAQHDYDTKKHHVERFLRHKDKVKVTIMFRGREVTHPERGTAILDRLAEELSELGVVEQRPMQEGRNMTMMMAPSKAVLAGRVEVPESSDGEVRPGAHVGDVASAAIGAPPGGNGAGSEAAPEGEAAPTSDSEPTAEAAPSAEAESTSDAEPTAEAAPSAEAEPAAEAEAEPAPEEEAPAEPEPKAKPKAKAKAKSASK